MLQMLAAKGYNPKYNILVGYYELRFDLQIIKCNNNKSNFFFSGAGTCSQSNFRYKCSVCVPSTSDSLRPKLQSDFCYHRTHEINFMVQISLSQALLLYERVQTLCPKY